ncbi:MAG: hypothetical protein WCT23_04285 [Candidatus Neomarinimicrobiota bacterium]|jgi:hypothetical protein
MTAQIGEKLIINDNQIRMAFCPPLPENDSRIVVNDENEKEEIFYSTACWRGYV